MTLRWIKIRRAKRRYFFPFRKVNVIASSVSKVFLLSLLNILRAVYRTSQYDILNNIKFTLWNLELRLPRNMSTRSLKRKNSIGEDNFV